MEGQQNEITPVAQEPSPEKKSLAKRAGKFIKNRVKNYILNLDPRGKDKFWWTGNLLNVAATASLFAFAPAEILVKSIIGASVSVGTYLVEKSMETHRKRNWTDEQRADHAAKMQEKHPSGTGRLRRFLLGISAGGVYGAAIGMPFALANPESFHPIKNAERRFGITKK